MEDINDLQAIEKFIKNCDGKNISTSFVISLHLSIYPGGRRFFFRTQDDDPAEPQPSPGLKLLALCVH